MKCRNCVFFFDYDHKTLGECHKRSPNFTICDEGNDAMWPSVKKLDWCGEFQPKIPEQTVSKDILSQPILVLNLPARIHRALGRADIRNIGTLIEISAHSLLDLRDFGDTALCNVRRKLLRHGLFLRGDNGDVE